MKGSGMGPGWSASSGGHLIDPASVSEVAMRR